MVRFVLDRLAWFLLAAMCGVAATAETLVVSGPTMGTTYHVKLVGVTAADQASIRTEIEAVLADVDERLSTYRQDSEVSRFNRAPAGKWFAVSPATAEVVDAALAVSRQTGGALDVTVGPLVRLWHFGPSAISETKSAADLAPPDERALRAARKLIGYEKLEVRRDPPALRKRVDGLEIDLSAVGEGDAIDRLAAAIAQRGIKNFLVELGGEVRASGRGPGGKPWRVAVERPLVEQPEVQAAVSLSNAALATSGDYRRFFEHGGRRYSHIIDPSTGWPVNHRLASVTVAADNAMTADAWDTALLVLGPQRSYDCAVEHGIAALLISRADDDFVVRETPAWRTRFPTATSSSPAGPRTRSP
jgi:thiamine biosynthesis lipoprotein